MRKFIDIKGKVSLYSNRITFSYNQWCHQLHLESTQYKQFPLTKKKKKERKEKERKEVEKRRRRKRDGKSLFGRKEKGENEMWKKR